MKIFRSLAHLTATIVPAAPSNRVTIQASEVGTWLTVSGPLSKHLGRDLGIGESRAPSTPYVPTVF